MTHFYTLTGTNEKSSFDYTSKFAFTNYKSAYKYALEMLAEDNFYDFVTINCYEKTKLDYHFANKEVKVTRPF